MKVMSGGQLIDGQIQSVYYEGWTGGRAVSTLPPIGEMWNYEDALIENVTAPKWEQSQRIVIL